jgi:hypothetical protein
VGNPPSSEPCFYEGENTLVIHPDKCIDNGVCEPQYPVDTIKADTEPGLEKWLFLKRKMGRSRPLIPRQKCLEVFTGDVPIRDRVLRLVAEEHRQFVSWTAKS